MEKELVIQKVKDYIAGAEDNFIGREIALSEEIAGMRIYDDPLFGLGDASDPLFSSWQKEDVIGKHAMVPEEWLPGAKSVISIFLPFSEALRKSNGMDMERPSDGWLHGRIEGQIFLNKICAFARDLLIEAGNKAVAPCLERRFLSITEKGTNPAFREDDCYTSNWSERHAAYICGLGTFGLSKGLITEKGIAGRFGSVITNAVFPHTKRAYQSLYEYCTGCGACASHCPAHAISKTEGKKHEPCSAFVNGTMISYAPRYGCGKCQVQVPCESGIPAVPSRLE